MSPTGKAFYVTTPIYYVNDAPHIGHAYTTVAADTICRWHRQRGENVWLLTGTDEHGEKVLRTAEAAGVTPQQWADRLVAEHWKPVLATLDVANDDFIRTTERRHESRVQNFLTRLKDSGHIYSGDYEGPYCVGCEEFKLSGDLVPGTGELEGQMLCPVHSRPVEMVSETNWFFRLSAFGDALLRHYEDHPDAVAPQSAHNEVTSFIRSGLQDLSISRSSFDWGIPVPWDTSQVVYVWFDALLNYATAVGLGDEPPSSGAAKFAATWPADIHLVGKDILRFHAVIWPAMLMAAGLPLPGQVYAHGWLLVGGEKMSKSKLTGIAPEQIIDHFGVDAFRYYFLRAIQFGNDGSFSWEDMAARYTSELANGLGNLGSRATAMVGKYFDGRPARPGRLRQRRPRAGRCPARGRPGRRRRLLEAGLHRGDRRCQGLRRRGQPLRHRAGALGPGQACGRPGGARAAGDGALHDVRGAARHRRAAQLRDAACHGRAVGVDRRGRGPRCDR